MNIIISPNARAKILALAKEKELTSFYWRIKMQAGGCQGLSVSYSLETTIENSDNIIDAIDFKVIIDPKSAIFLNGMTLDWSQTLLEKRFTLTLPTAKAQCSCGSSFSL